MTSATPRVCRVASVDLAVALVWILTTQKTRPWFAAGPVTNPEDQGQGVCNQVSNNIGQPLSWRIQVTCGILAQ